MMISQSVKMDCSTLSNQTPSLPHTERGLNSKQSGRSSRSSARTSCRTSSTASKVYHIGNFPQTSIPGYTGYMPGIYPEARYGASNHRLLQDINIKTPKRTRSASLYRPGLDVVGYTGFVPGKHAGNVFGQTFSESNCTSQKLFKPASCRQRSNVSRTLEEYQRRSPSSDNGNYDMYKNMYR